MTFLRRTDAPIADEPMPASQAKTMLWIGPLWVPAAAPPVSIEEIDDFLPFMASIEAVALVRSVVGLVGLDRMDATRKVAVARDPRQGDADQAVAGGLSRRR